MTAAPIIAMLDGSHTCSALGVTARSPTPVLALCRRLLETGIDGDRPLHVYRGDVLALIVISVAQGAALEVNSAGTGFIARRERRAGPYVRKSGAADAGHRSPRQAVGRGRAQ
jgi:hypothetical protein